MSDPLMEGLSRLRAQPGVAGAACSAIEHWLASATPESRASFSPRTLATMGAPYAQILGALLHGVTIGFLDLHLKTRCPDCDNLASECSRLQQASGLSHCAMCNSDFVADAREHMDVTFSLNRAIEESIASDSEWAQGSTPPLRAPAHGDGGGDDEKRLSLLELIHFPIFRQLFRHDTLSDRENLAISSVTILFTDITGSTSMYEALGDVRAYNVVREHFAVLTQVIQEQEGVVVKTIGDAVMASFFSNVRAFYAVARALSRFQAWNSVHDGSEKIQIRIGLHRGRTILVNLNEGLDYFGSTVNKAARIQSLTGSDEIAFSDTVYADPQVQAFLKEQGVRKLRRTRLGLRGLEGEQVVYKVEALSLLSHARPPAIGEESGDLLNPPDSGADHRPLSAEPVSESLLEGKPAEQPAADIRSLPRTRFEI